MATHPIYLVAVTVAALITAKILCQFGRAPAAHGRFLSIDGLRGFCALFAFICHAATWYFKLHTGEWRVPPSNLYTHLGQTSIMFLFMVTGFLFFSKVLDSTRQAPLDWLRLFVSRCLRLGPLYLAVVLAVLLIVGASTGWQRQVPFVELLGQIGSWVMFTIPGAPDINAVPQTWLMVAGATWTLPYEWVFYLSLPLIAALTLKPVRIPYLALSLVAIGWAWASAFEVLVFVGLGGGVASAILARSGFFRRFAVSPLATCLAMASVGWVIYRYPSAYGLAQLAWLTLAFSLVAAGNTLWGVLTLPSTRKLGEVAYGVYLLHGLLLYLVFSVAMAPGDGRALTPSAFWAVISLVGICLVALSAAAYRWIEEPALTKTTAITRALRR